MVLTQLPLDLSNQTILDVTRGIYKDALAVKHVQDDETDEYECLWCDENEVACQQKFTSMSEFVNHINYAHMNDDNTDYICMWKGCSRRTPGAKSCAFKGKVENLFKAKYKLVNHMRVHSGEKPFKCDHPNCNKTFARTENLKIHKRTHTGDKPFKCFEPGCDRTFSNSSDRKKHMNVHKKGVLICPLPGCDRSYSHPSSMRKHMKTHGAAAKGLPLPERMVDQYYSASYFNVMPNEPFRRRKKYNLKGSNNQPDNQSSSNSDSDDQNVAPMTSSPNGNHMVPFAHMINRSGSDSGHETSGQPSPEHTIDQDYNGQFHLGFNMGINPVQLPQFDNFIQDQMNQASFPTGFPMNDFAAYNQFANNFAYWSANQNLNPNPNIQNHAFDPTTIQNQFHNDQEDFYIGGNTITA